MGHVISSEEYHQCGLDGLYSAVDEIAQNGSEDDPWVSWDDLCAIGSVVCVAERLGFIEAEDRYFNGCYRITDKGIEWLSQQRFIYGLFTEEHGCNITDVGVTYGID